MPVDTTTDFRPARVLTRRQVFGRALLKRMLYGSFYLQQALLIMFGRQKPVISFKVEASPPSLYYNFPILDDKVEELVSHLGLAPQLHPVAVRTLRGCEARFWLTLNMYRVSGITSGLRAEWSVYIRDLTGTSRYCVVDACTSQGSMDPVDVIVRAGEISHVGDERAIHSSVRCKLLGDFSCDIDLANGTTDTVEADSEWIEANDFIYWRNGVCDRAYYEAGMANAQMSLIRLASNPFQGTTWTRFVDTDAAQVVRIDNAMDLAISPWWNL